MVRAGVVKHPSEWEFCGYNEIQSPRKRKGIIDFDRLMGLLGFENYDDLKDTHYKWVNSAMQTDNSGKENKWTQSIAVGSKTFIKKMKEALGFRVTGRKIFREGRCMKDCFMKRFCCSWVFFLNQFDAHEMIIHISVDNSNTFFVIIQYGD